MHASNVFRLCVVPVYKSCTQYVNWFSLRDMIAALIIGYRLRLMDVKHGHSLPGVDDMGDPPGNLQKASLNIINLDAPTKLFRVVDMCMCVHSSSFEGSEFCRCQYNS